jgi:hypothetical protein
MKDSLSILSVAPLLVSYALAQISRPIPISQAPSLKIESRPNWALQNLTLVSRSDPQAAVSPTTSIEFTLSTGRNLPAFIRCIASYDPNKPPKDLQKCTDNATFWRFGRDVQWQEKDFWIDIVRPSFTPYVIFSLS